MIQGVSETWLALSGTLVPTIDFPDSSESEAGHRGVRGVEILQSDEGLLGTACSSSTSCRMLPDAR